MKKILQLTIFFLSMTVGFAQEFTVFWDEVYESEHAEYLKDVINLPTGELAAVGYADAGKRKKAIFFKINPTDGNRHSYREFSPTGEDVFNSVAVTAYGRLIMVGSGMMGNRDGEEGLIVKLNIDGSDPSVKLFQRKEEDKRVGMDRFDKIIWTAEGHGYIAGKSDQKGAGWIWLGKVDNEGEFTEMNSLGLGMVEELVEFGCYDGENSWICANTGKSDRSKKGDVLVLKINKNGTQDFDKIVFEENSSNETAVSASISPNGSILVGGEMWQKNSSNSDGFLAHFTEEGKNIYGESFGKGLNDEITTVFHTLDETKWYFQKTTRGKTLYQKLVKGKKEFREVLQNVELKGKKGKAFEPISLFKTHYGTYILAGVQERGDESTAIRMICFGENQTPLTAKATPRLESQKIWLDDLNKDEYLSPLEDGAIKVKLKNIGDKDIVGGSLSIANLKEITGIEFPFPKVFIDYIPKGKERTVSIAVKGGLELTTGSVPIKLQVTAEKYALDLDYQIQTIEVKKAMAGSPITMFWKDPDITQTRSRELEVYDSQKKVRITILSNQSIESSEPVMTNNGTPLIDDKSIDKRHLTPPVPKSGGFQYTFTYNVSDLKEGRNVLRVKLDDYTSDSIILNYNVKRLPTLHVLAIGPKYPDLKYTKNDAQSFADAIEANIDKRFFDDVEVTMLVDSANTTKTEIEGVFEEFYKKFRRDEIKSHDYFMVFYSGHGLRRDGKFFMVPSNYNSERERSTTIDYKEDILEEFLNKMICKKILFLDACLSGNAKRATDGDISNALFQANQIAEETIIFTSCSKDELSYEHEDWGNGAYTEALLDALTGQAILSTGEVLYVDAGYRKRTPNGDFLMDESGNVAVDGTGNSIVTVRELSNFLEKRVKDLVNHKKEGAKQTPTIHLNGMSESLLIFTLNKDKKP